MNTFFVPQTVGKALVATLIVMTILRITGAQVMTSSNYKIQSDSINVNGGLATSSNYGLESTMGELVTGNSSSTNYQLRAGYQQMQEVYMSLSSAADITLAASLGGLTGGVSTESITVLAITDSPAGYQLTLRAVNSPAMQSGVNTIADYVPSGAVPDFVFTTDPTDAHVGYSPEGVHTVARFKDNGSVCGSGALEATQRCWDGLSTTARVIANSSAANHPSGATTTVRFQVGIGANINVIAGSYVATTTLTAIPL